MASTPKWYCRNKTQPIQGFAEISRLGKELRRITKRIIIDVKVDIFSEHDTILEECEKIVELYWNLKNGSKNDEFMSLSRKIKRSPYNTLLMRKFKILMDINDRRFCKLTFVLKQTLTDLLRKSTQSEVWLNWALQITQLYNKCRYATDSDSVGFEQSNESKMTANICSNMYPALMLPQKPPIDFAYVLQLVSQTRVEQNSLDLLFGLFNMGEQDSWPDNCGESNCSSLEILRILTLNITGDGEFQQYYDQLPKEFDDNGEQEVCLSTTLRGKHTEQFLLRERAFIEQLIAQASQICPTIFGSSCEPNLNDFITRGIRLVWSYVGLVLDHIVLWWIDTPISCYSLTHVDSIRHWLHTQKENGVVAIYRPIWASITLKALRIYFYLCFLDIPEPVFSTLRGIGEILTSFVCINVWDQLFRLTLSSDTCTKDTVDSIVDQYKGTLKNQLGTPVGTVWVVVFTNLTNLSNNYFHKSSANHSHALPVAEQIPILHRVDHSVHTMRLWVTEQAKQLCCEWKMDRFFQILEYDVTNCLEIFKTLKLPKLTADLSDVLMLVCVALRTKLICEVNTNLDKLKKTTDECVHIMSSVCRTLSLANFTLCFPAANYWQRNAYDSDTRNEYVAYVLNQIFLPAIRATHDLSILKLLLKIICEAWLDHIYQKRIRFSVEGAVQLLNDFDDVGEWIRSCTLLEQQHLDVLSKHEVLRMCKGVGKILLRKPEDIIAITQTPKFSKRPNEVMGQETQLPSEMFVSNQKHWLELRARNSNFPCLKLCCSDECL